MKLTQRAIFLFCLASVPVFAGTWSGPLVDSKCYASKQRNVQANVHPGSIDNNRPIRYCSATAKTKSFALVQQDGSAITLDPGGNEKAIELVRKTGKHSRYNVDVSGEMGQNSLNVDTISVAK